MARIQKSFRKHRQIPVASNEGSFPDDGMGEDDVPTTPIKATWQAVAKMIRDGSTPAYIMEKFNITPGRLRRKLRSKRLHRYLTMVEDLASSVVRHRRKANIHDLANRLAYLAYSSNDEIARKVATDMFNDAAKAVRLDDDATAIGGADVDKPNHTEHKEDDNSQPAPTAEKPKIDQMTSAAMASVSQQQQLQALT